MYFLGNEVEFGCLVELFSSRNQGVREKKKTTFKNEKVQKSSFHINLLSAVQRDRDILYNTDTDKCYAVLYRCDIQ